MFNVTDRTLDIHPEARPANEMAANMRNDPRLLAAQMRANDRDACALREGSERRLRAAASRLFDAEFAVHRAIKSGSIDKGRDESITSVLAVTMVLSAGAASVGAYMSEPWWPYVAAVAAVSLAATVWRAIALPRRFARRSVLPIITESLAMLAPTLTELEMVVERGRNSKLASARLLRDRDLRTIVARGEGNGPRYSGSHPPPPPLPALSTPPTARRQSPS